MASNSCITILCGNKKFVLEENLLLISKYFLTAKDCDPSLTVINLPSINPDTFEKIIPYLVHMNGKEGQNIERPIKQKSISEIYTDKWIVDYINKMIDTEIFDILHTSNYLNITCLTALCACKIACIISTFDSVKEVNQYISKLKK